MDENNNNEEELRETLEQLKQEENDNETKATKIKKKVKLITIVKIVAIILFIIFIIWEALPFIVPSIEKNTYSNEIGNVIGIDLLNDDYLIVDNYEKYKQIKASFYSADSKTLFTSEARIKLNFDKFNRLFFINHNLLCVTCPGNTRLESNVQNIATTNDTINVSMYVDTYGVTATWIKDVYFIPISKNITNANVSYNYKSYSNEDGIIDILKPVIYIYPEKEETLEVKVGCPEKFTCVYPEYNDGWKVTAYPDGTLVDESGRKYYSLYYEAENTKKYDNKLEEGFVISKEEIVPFLEEKLEYLGLNEKESEEFIIYWLPKLQKYDYIYVRFQTEDEIEENMPLEFSKTPDTLIRIMMEWKGLNEKIEVKEQKLEMKERQGFSVVEWGGTILN